MDLLKQSSSTILFFYSLENEVFAIFSKNLWIYLQKDVENIKIFDIMINIYLGGVCIHYIFEAYIISNDMVYYFALSYQGGSSKYLERSTDVRKR